MKHSIKALFISLESLAILFSYSHVFLSLAAAHASIPLVNTGPLFFGSIGSAGQASSENCDHMFSWMTRNRRLFLQ